MPSVSLALLWHQHQPYYPDDVSGETLMPWVRLHGVKDYIGMALHIAEVPEFRCTINLVPSLLVQINRYAHLGGSDRHLDVSRTPADGLSESDALYLLDYFFMASVDNLIRPFPQYYELYLKRRIGTDTAEAALSRFNERDLRDLQVWNNLVWMHPLLFERDAELRAFRDKGGRWTEEEKRWLLDRQIGILGEIIPLHRKLAEGGQVELTTTPFFHPILPLLWDKTAAREGLPGCEMPRFVDPYPEDATLQLRRGVEQHRQLFGTAPRGLWPSEGSVSQGVLAAIADAGIEWIATDEEILAHSTDGFVSRDAQGHLTHPEMLYRPWRIEEQGRSMQIVFRDHGLSDLIGFHYQRNDPLWAADDLLARVQSIGRAVEPHNAGRPALVSIILDGENCWEYYPDGGVTFLRRLYRQAAAHPHVRPVRMIDHLTEHPAADRINRLFAGSWISHNFAIWIGHAEDRTAWDLLHETREYLVKSQASGTATPESLRLAWEELYIAEGSDWYWWFGEDHSSAQDDLFDQLFRKHLQNVYTLLLESPPPQLQRPIKRLRRRMIHTQPRGLVTARVDGRYSYFEWLNAGRYEAGSERGTMTLVSEGVIHGVHFGFSHEMLFVRIDTARAARQDLSEVEELRLRFLEPAGVEIRVSGWAAGEIVARLHREGRATARPRVAAAVDRIVEIGVPLSDLKVAPGSPLHLFVELLSGRRSVDRAPSEGTIEITAPTQDFEMVMWQA